MILYSLESLWNSLQEYPGVHLIWSSFEASEYPKTVGSSGHTQKSASSFFDQNFLLWTPILMILDSIESLWKCLQEYPKVHIIRSSFGHWFNASVEPVLLFHVKLNQFSIYLSSFFDPCFARALYSSLGPNMTHSINFISPMIMLSIDHQNHSKWSKWGHVRYNLYSSILIKNFLAPLVVKKKSYMHLYFVFLDAKVVEFSLI